MTEFLHGVETTRQTTGPRTVSEVRTAIIGLVGTAPIHHASNPKAVGLLSKVTSDRDLEPYGPDLAGYTIPHALLDILGEGTGTVLVINVFDPTVHKTTVAETSRTITDGTITLPDADLISLTVKKNGDPDVLAEEGDDYTVDRVTGVITIVEGGILDGETAALVAHVAADPSAVDVAAILGEVSEGVRIGAQALLDAGSKYGFGAKILIAPDFTTDPECVAGLLTLADKLRAFVYADVTPALTPGDVVDSRGADGPADLQIANPRLVYCWPRVKTGGRFVGLSADAAGITAATDRDRGYHKSPSNRLSKRITELEVALTASINDPTCDVNQLNGAGIMTVAAFYGQGFRLWGNRASNFPGAAGIDTFIAATRTMDIVDESVELASLPFVDEPITDVVITSILDTVNEFIRILVGRGALATGSRVEFFPEDNPSTELQDGKMVFTKTYCPNPPGERITYKSLVDTTLLKRGE